jgi:hypothetical protein
MTLTIPPHPATPGDHGPATPLCDGAVLAGRYTILHKLAAGWLAYDERLARPVCVHTIVGDGAPSERVRREAATAAALLDAVVVGDEAYAIRRIS